MKVSIISYTPDALELLLFTKQTRLSMDAGLMEEIKAWPPEKKQKELDYMRGTIQSSWEFCDVTFSLEGVSRAFTHQFVRTRAGSYAQQSQRTVNMEDFEYITPAALDSAGIMMYEEVMVDINKGYHDLIDIGANPQDARGVLPTNIATNIIASFNLRTLADMAKLRLCSRTQGEYQDIFREMRKKVIELWPWAADFIQVYCAATGVCCFPNYKECPIKPPIFNPETGARWDEEIGWDGALEKPATRKEIQAAWETMKFEAIPKQTKKES